VYDARSEDTTAQLAASCGARVVGADWQGFAIARKAAAALVTTQWTFMLDADERLTDGGCAELRGCNPSAETLAYSVPRKNFFCGRWIRGAGWWPDRLVRLFRTGAAKITSPSGSAASAVHERWEVDGAIARLTEPIEHYSYSSVGSYRSKFARYTSLEAANQKGRISFASLAAAEALVPFRAAWLLIVRGGILDGWRGAYVSLGSACYPAVVKWKAWRR
jgi:hypothetical protein